MKDAEFAERIDNRIQQVLERDDLTIGRKREIAETLEIQNTYGIVVEDTFEVELD